MRYFEILKSSFTVVNSAYKISKSLKSAVFFEAIDKINNKTNEALEQIERKKYYKTLLAHGIELDKIKRVPIVFAGKEPYITKLFVI